MKNCPKCGTAYTDDTLSFCLSDGTPLTDESDDHETEVLPNMLVNLETDDSVSNQTQIKAAPTDENLTQSVASNPKKGVSSLWILATFGLLGLIVCGFAFAWFFFVRNNPQEDSNRTPATNKNTTSKSTVKTNTSAENSIVSKPILTPTPKTKTYRVVGVKSNDVLYIRPRPGNLKVIVGKIPSNGTGIKITGKGKRVGKSIWVPVVYSGNQGWVNRKYLSKTK